MFFDNWAALGRVLVVGTLAYVTLLVVLRLTGKRTLSKLNAFDLVVTVALGSTLATVLLDKQITLAEGALAFALLAALQYAITWMSMRSHRFKSLVKAEPALLAHDGALLPQAMWRERITADEIDAALRQAGLDNVREAKAVVLESDGSLSVVPAKAQS